MKHGICFNIVFKFFVVQLVKEKKMKDVYAKGGPKEEDITSTFI